MLHCSQTSATQGPKLIPKPTNSQTHIQKPLFLAGAFRALFKPPPPPRKLQVTCNINGSLLSSPEKLIRRDDEVNPISSTDYLISSLGLPPESAAGFTKLVMLKSTGNADSVLALFRDYGFASSHLAQIFSTFPKLLLSNPHKTLKPKLDCFVENGISGEILIQVLTSDPHILRISLRRRIIPCLRFLHAFYDGDGDAVATHLTLRRGTRVLRNFTDTTVPNVETLLAFGVPKPYIAKLLSDVIYFSKPTDEFSETVEELKEMGFRPTRATFLRALNSFLSMDREKRAAKMEVFKRFGITEEQVRAMLLRQPQCFESSEEKLNESLEFFITKLQWSIDDITKYYTLLTCSIEKRITPRLAVLEILHSKGLVEKTSFRVACHFSESYFLHRYVTRYKQQLPDLLEVYEKNMAA